jgi:hypothetical protein
MAMRLDKSWNAQLLAMMLEIRFVLVLMTLAFIDWWLWEKGTDRIARLPTLHNLPHPLVKIWFS